MRKRLIGVFYFIGNCSSIEMASLDSDAIFMLSGRLFDRQYNKMHKKIGRIYIKRRKNHAWCTINMQKANVNRGIYRTDKDNRKIVKIFVDLARRDILKTLTKRLKIKHNRIDVSSALLHMLICIINGAV